MDRGRSDKISVSIIMPVYNGQKFVERAILSVINQTLPEKELIIINDGSDDETSVILEKFRAIREDIIIVNQKNKGVAFSRNTGVNLARGEYIGFTDSDDWCEPEMFKVLYDDAHENNLDIAFCNFDFDYGGIKKNIKGLDLNTAIYEDQSEVCKLFFRNKLNGHLWNKIFKKELFINYKIEFINNRIFEEIPTVPLLILNSKKTGSTDKIFYHYCIHERSYTQIFNARQLDIFFQFDELEKRIEGVSAYSSLILDIRNYYLRIVKYFLNNLIHTSYADPAILKIFRSTVVPKARQFLNELQEIQLTKKEIKQIKFSLWSIFLYYKYSRLKIRLYYLIKNKH